MKKQSFFKKSYLWMLAACIGLQATSCTNENDPAGGNESNMITFTVTPDYGVKTRAISELPAGAEALRYIMEVYDGTSLVADSRQVQSTTAPGMAIQFSLSKAPGKAYTVVFWADYTAADKEDVYFDTTTGGLKDITLKKVLDAAEKCQAFSGTIAIDEKGEPATTSASLTRAVAQVNLKTTNQLTGYGSVKVAYGEAEANAPVSHFNALDGTAATNAVISGVTNTVDGTQAATELSPYTFHTYYVLAPKATKSVINMVVDLCSDAGGTTSTKQIKIASIPLQANYRTNITGGFGLGDNTFDVSCKEEWETPDNGIQLIWDGSIPEANGSYTFSGGTGDEATPYVIADSKDLVQLVANVNGGTNYEGKYFELANDLDLNNKEWTPIGTGSNNFKGNFNGDFHKISNLNLNTTTAVNAGLFGYISNTAYGNPNGVIKNLHVSGNITNTKTEVQHLGGICGNADNFANISNCSFEGSITGVANYVGGICGHIGSGTTVCASKNSGNIISTDSSGYAETGGIAGSAASSVITNCYNEGNIKGTKYVGGITGHMMDAGAEIGDCYNTGEITCTDGTSDYVGAICVEDGNDRALGNCYVTASYKTTLSGNYEKIFANGTWPTWTAGVDADGTNSKGYWRSIGSWDDVNPVYPTLWWE